MRPHPSRCLATPLPPAAVALLLAAAACGGRAGTEPDPPDGDALAAIVAVGRLERGLPVVLRAVTSAGDTLPPGSVSWRVDPADAGALSGDTLRLERAGPVHVTALRDGDELGRTLDVAVPPLILFDMVVDGNRDLYRAALDGGDLERLTTHAGADSDPTVAGDVVVFVSDRDGNGELYALSLAGGGEDRLTTTVDPEKHPALSPDGTRLAFARGYGLARVYVAAADASGAERPDPAHGHDGTLELSPAWSPDGESLAFVSTAAGNPDIFRWSGGPATLLEGGSGGEFEPAWSPDGRWIAFASTRDGDAELYLLRLSDGAVTRLTEREGSDGQPAWLADGRIVYVAYTGTTPSLRWLDPERPGEAHAIPLPGPARNPVAVPQ
ncbi:MAG TPA: hypothetical protein VF158_16110 [Longimicrobiales bacterium]